MTSRFKDIDQVKLKDALNGRVYTRKIENLSHQGLYVDLRAYQSHLFNFKPI